MRRYHNHYTWKRFLAVVLVLVTVCANTNISGAYAQLTEGSSAETQTEETTEETTEEQTQVTTEAAESTQDEETTAAESSDEDVEETTEAAESSGEETEETTAAESSGEEVSESTADVEETTESAESTTEETEETSVKIRAMAASANFDLSSYNNDLLIYSYVQYTTADGTIAEGTTDFSLTGTTTLRSVKIGSQTGGTAQDHEIDVTLDELTMSGNAVMTIYPVYENSENTVNLTVDGESSLENLVLEENAALCLTLNADLTVSTLTMKAGSSLSVDTNGYTLTVTTVAGSEDDGMTITGSGTVKTGSFAIDGDLSLTNVTLHGTSSSADITAGGDITVTNATVENADFFGFPEDATGEHTLTFAGSRNTVSSVTTTGAADGSSAIVVMEGLSTVKFSASAYSCDYQVTYVDQENTALSYKEGWVQYYRVSAEGSTTQAVGSLAADSEGTLTYSEAGDEGVELPEYTVEGYTYTGWTDAETGNSFAYLTTQTGALTLSPLLSAGKVVVVLDRGYDPDETTNDDYDSLERQVTAQYSIADTVALEAEAERFGYTFGGWAATDTEGEANGSVYTGSSCTVALADVQTDGDGNYVMVSWDETEGTYEVSEEGDSFLIVLTAQWTANTYPLTLIIGTQMEVDDVEISVDGEETWQTLAELAANTSGVTWTEGERKLSFSTQITYAEETLGEYFTRVFGNYPVLKDIRTGGERQDFVGWITTTSKAVTEDSTFALYSEKNGNETGFLSESDRGSYTLSEFGDALHSNPISLMASWTQGTYTLTTDTADGWTIYVDGTAVTPDENGQITGISYGATVTYACSVSNTAGISQWSIVAVDTDGGALSADLGIEERTYSSGDSMLYYDFSMPALDVIATTSKRSETDGYSSLQALLAQYEGDETYADLYAQLAALLALLDDGNTWVDLYDSPITFAEGVDAPSERTVAGFWYNKRMLQMTPLFQATDDSYGSEYNGWYFYAWDSSEYFYVTSSGKETQNQLTLVNTVTVYLKNCVMVPTEAYSTDAVGTSLGSLTLTDGASLSTQTSSWSQYGNIVLNNETNASYTANIYIDGANTIGAIFPSTYNSASTYEVALNIQGASGTSDGGSDQLELGSIWGFLTFNITNLYVKAYENDSHVIGKDDSDYLFCALKNTSSKSTNVISASKVEAKDKAINLYYGYHFNITNSDVHVGRIRSLTYSQSYWSGNTSVTIEGDYYGSHVIFEDSTSVTVGGSMFGGYFYMRSSGNLIVKGAVLSYLREMSGTGTVAANVISVDSSATYSGGTIIANQLTNCLYSSVSAATVKDQRYTDFTFSSTSSTAVSDYGSLTPFITYATSSSTVTTYTFSGSSLWLFGYVPDTVDGHYDMTVSVMDGSSNPLNAIITALEAGDLTDSVLEQQMEDTDSEAECVMIGSPAYDSTRRTVSVSGSAIRAAGNLTFWNDTEITAGTVTAGGSLLCMRDMTISGGAVTADAIGNVYTNTVTDAENNVRWCETIIDGVTVTADLVGAPTDRNDSWTPRSTVVLQNGGSVTSHKEVSVTFVQDIYINYVYDTSIFSVSNDRPQTLRFTGSSLESMSLVDDSLEALASVSVAAPTVIADKSEGSWHFESLTGPVTASFRADGTVLDKEGEAAEDESAYQDKELLVLYAVQDENTLTVVEGSEYVNSTFTVGDGSRTFNASYAAEVSSGSTVTLTLTEAAVTAGMADNKFVVWYYTGSEENDNLVLHSVETEVAEGSISFEMPYTATEVYVTNELTLYLNLYEIQFTSTGFNVELGDSPREDACFTYAGNLRITQSNIDSTTTPHTNYSVSYPVKAVVDGETESTASDTVSQYVTNNHMVFAAGSGSTGRTVTFESVIQRSETTDPGIDVADGEDITLTIDGAVQLGNINIDSGTVSIVGANKDEDKDILHIARIWTEWDFVSSTLIGNSSGTSTANIDMRDLTLYVGNRMTFAYTMGGMVTLTDCFVNAKNWVYYSVFAMYADQVTFDKTSVYIGYGSDTDRTNNFCFFRSCNNVTVKNDSSVEYYLTGSGSGDYSSSFYSGVTGTMTIENSKVTTKYATDANNSGSQLLTWSALPTKVVVSGDSVLTVDQRLMLKALEVTDDASVVVKNDDADSYLFCQDVTVNTTGTVSADYIVISGFVYATDSFVSDNSFMSSTSSYVTSGSFSLQNGTVEAKFVGGDLDATIAVSGGTLNADTVGTYGALFGYTRYVPKRNGEKWAYTLEQIPESAAVTISGGTVNISDYLGGMNSTVSVTGGKVKLADGAVLGITDEDLETLMTSYSEAGEEMGTSCTVSITGGTVEATGTNGTASILADYGSVYIGGDCEGVSVYDLTAENGEITIESVSGVYTNPYRGTDKDHNQVGIYVSHLLEAQEILIQAGAVVWAAEAYANVEDGDQGSLTVVADVEDGQANSGYLYTEQYGSGGAGETTVETVQDSESVTHIYGTQVSTITYYLNDDETDPATNDGNPTSYTLGQTNSDGSLTVTLVEPEREHYQFTGWYDNEECEGDPVGLSLSTSSAINYTLYAGWEPETVTFTITVTADDSYDLEEETEGKAGTLSADKTSFTFTQTVTVAYRDAIIGDGDGHIVLSNFDLNSYAIRQLKVDDTDYSGEVGVISDSTVVTKDLVEEYLDTDTINLTAVLVTKKSVKITLDLNQNEYGRPTTTAFESSLTEAEKTESTYLYTYVDINANILTADGFYTGTLQADGSVTGKALIGATATGYDFLGWFDEDDSQLTADFTVTQNGSSTFYAKWSPKTYTVSFDANGGSAVTASSSVEPTATDPDAMTGTVVYDTEIDGGIAWSATETEQSLPTAWKSGYVFLGWSTDPNGDENSILAEDAELNAETLESALNTEAGTDETALTLYAVYRKVQITYITAGGTWQNGWSGETYTDTDPDTSLGYSAPLAAYQYEESTETYAFISTTATEFSTNGDNYNDGDYRETIQYKGYTFTGWYLTDAETGEVSETDAVTSTPLYSDITVTAGWTANSYSLNLYAYEEGENDTFNSFTYGGTQPVTGYVTVGKEITESNAGSWPDRSDWYAASNSATSGDDDAKRYLLGFTFDAFEPGDSLAEEGTDGYTAYNAYGTKVTELVNNNTLFTREETGADGTTSGSIFYLPDGSVYGSSHASDESDVPDYPNGSTIDMYAVYREVSLVFIEYYTDQDNQVQETVMSSVPWNDYYDYPSDYETDGWQKLVEDQGYTLISWKIGGTDETLPDYGSDTYGEESLRQQYKDAAAATGAMDIKVYTYYVAQVTVEDEQWLTSNTNPRDSENLYSQESVEYIIPGSMKSGTLNYKIAYTETTDGTADTELKLVTWDDLKDYLYETSWGSGNTANNTVAIKLELLAQDETTGEWEAVDLSNGSGVYETWLKESGSIGNVTVVSGWKLRLTMYHSGVISESLTDLYDLTFTYANNEEQYIKFENLYLDLEPSVWDVNYVLNLPNDARITWPESGFVEETTYRTVSTEYGADLWDASCLPAVAGYEASAVWTVTSGASETTVAMGNPFTLTVSAESAGAATLEVTWTKKSYTLSADEDVLQKDSADWWKVSYGDEALNRTFLQWLTGQAASAAVPYLTTVVFSNDDAAAKAENILLTLTYEDESTETVRLDEYEEVTYDSTEGTYTFLMPAASVHASYSDTVTLYLEGGNITIEEDGYTYNGEYHTWSGSYIILMDAENNLVNEDGVTETSNTLTLEGDLSGRSIALGNLSITSDDSIVLTEGSTAELTLGYNGTASTIDAQNILVPAGADLTMNLADDVDTGTLNLSPSSGYAAIGGSSESETATSGAQSGTITLNDLTVNLTLSAGNASGIGSGDQSSGGGEITLTDCVITVTEAREGATSYTGVWIGGNGVSSVTLDGTQVALGADSTLSADLQTYTLYADEIAIINESSIGTESAPVRSPIYAEDELTITDSTVYQNIQNVQTYPVVAIGTSADGSMTISGSTVDAEVRYPADGLYTGTLYIEDAASDVVIAGTQILETNNGNIAITDEKVIQGSSSHDHDGSYLIINSYADDGTADSAALTATSIADSKTITTAEVTLTNVDIDADTTIILDGDLTITGKVDIASGVTLTVDAAAVNDQEEYLYGVTLESSATVTDNSGTYAQEGGSLASYMTDGIICDQLDIELTDVTTTAANLIAHNLTLDGGSVTATNGQVGSQGVGGVTTVSITNGTEITAATIGALGAQSSTFTFVVFTDEENDIKNLTGTLVRDWYRLTYVIADEYDTSNLPTVLRTTQIVADGSITATTVLDGVPDNPTPRSGFSTWYVINPGADETLGTADDISVALQETSTPSGFAYITQLNPTTVDYSNWTETTNSDDGTKTLKILAAMNISGTALIQEERQLSDTFDDTVTATSVSVPADGAWTAKFTVSGSVIAGSGYQLSLTKAFPAGTELTLAVLSASDNIVRFYHYTTTGDETTIALSWFQKMGGTESPTSYLMAGTAGATLADSFMIAADFSQAGSITASDYSDVSVQLQLIDDDSDVTGAAVSYSLYDAPTASVTAVGTANTVSATWSPKTADTRRSGETLYLVATLTDGNGNAVTVPYDAVATLGSTTGTWIAGDTVLFALTGDPESEQTYTNLAYSFEGLEEGTYQITWSLAVAASAPNVLGGIVATAGVVSYTAEAETAPSLAATITQIDGVSVDGDSADSRVLSEGTHTVTFRLTDISLPTGGTLQVRVEKQNTTLAAFEAEDDTTETVAVSGASATAEITLSDLTAGTYRIRFSMYGFAEGTKYADVYFTFVVE